MSLPDYFDVEFEGTASRRTFWLNQLACVASVFAVLLALLASLAMKSGIGMLVFGLLTLGVIVYAAVSGFAVGARRCRDLGHSGWMVLLYLVPFLWLPFAFYLGFARSKTTTSA